MSAKSLCPKCSDILPVDARACACGWRKEPARGKGEPDLGCPFNDHGHICGLRGSLSDSIVGGGPWYCPDHFWLLKGRAPARKAKPQLSPVSSFYEPREPGEDSPEDIWEVA